MKLAIAALVLAVLAAPAGAQAPQAGAADVPRGFTVVYSVHAKGITVGEFSYSVAANGQAYQAHAARRMTGLVRTFVGAKQDYSYEANGEVTDSGVQPLSYRHSGGKRHRVVQVTFKPDDIVTVSTPPMGMGSPPATREQKVGAVDQLSSIYAMAITKGDPCARTLHIYLDGRSRFDLVLHPNGDERVSTDAYRGLARRCSVQYEPIAGFGDPQQPATLSFLFAPIGGFNAPLRIAMPTDDAGIVTLEAKSFKPAP